MPEQIKLPNDKDKIFWNAKEANALSSAGRDIRGWVWILVDLNHASMRELTIGATGSLLRQLNKLEELAESNGLPPEYPSVVHKLLSNHGKSQIEEVLKQKNPPFEIIASLNGLVYDNKW